MKVLVISIPQQAQRYETLGDWEWSESGSTLHIHVTNQPDPRAEMALIVHELVEALLCKHRGITTRQVDEFDLGFIMDKREGEPGDAHDCPYKKEHHFAEKVERMLLSELGLTWDQYESILEESARGPDDGTEVE